MPCMMITLCVRFNIILIRSVLLSAEFASASVYIQYECHLLFHSDWLSWHCYGGCASCSYPTITLYSQHPLSSDKISISFTHAIYTYLELANRSIGKCDINY